MCDKYEKPTLVWGDEAFPEHDRTKWRPTTQAVPRMRLTVGHRAPHVCVVKMMNSVSSSVPDQFFFPLCCPRKGFPVLHGRLAKGGIMVLCTPQGGTMSLLNVDSREKLDIFGKIDNFAAKNLESKKSFSHN